MPTVQWSSPSMNNGTAGAQVILTINLKKGVSNACSVQNMCYAQSKLHIPTVTRLIIGMLRVIKNTR